MSKFIFHAEVATGLAVDADTFEQAVKEIRRLMDGPLNLTWASPGKTAVMFTSHRILVPARLVEIDDMPIIIDNK